MGRILWYLIPAVLAFPFWVCIYFCAKRLIGFCAKNITKKRLRRISVAASIIIMLPACNAFGVTGIWTIVILYICMFALLTQLINFIFKKCTRKEKIPIWDAVYRLCIIPLLCTITVLTYGYSNIRNIVQTNYSVTTSKELAQPTLKVALLSDIHFGIANTEQSIQEVCSKIAAHKVDLVLLCGDITDERTTLSQMRGVYKELGSIPSRYGTYFVYGNHDMAQYSDAPNYTLEQLQDTIKGNSIRILADECVDINDNVVLYGRKDRTQKRKPVQELLSDISKEKYCIVMDHQPEEFAQKAKFGTDLQVSGHTHAGQIFPLGTIMKWGHISDLYYGQKTVSGMKAIVTSGMCGWGYPIRTQKHSEYVLISIQGK